MNSLLAYLPLVALAGSAFWIYRLFKGRSWSRADGRIEKCEKASFVFGNQTEVPGVRLYYSFQVGSEYYGGRVAEIGFTAEEKIEGFLLEFAPETPLVVRFDPRQPDHCMVDAKDNPQMLSFVGIAHATWDDGGPDLGPLDLL